jgi:four helix bundle protein
MAGARRFQELDCWQLANEFKRRIYEVTERPRWKRDLKFYEQIPDAAASAPRNIAEGYGRKTHADFAQLLDIARGSLMECENHLVDAVAVGT